jgi:hypothetical protein
MIPSKTGHKLPTKCNSVINITYMIYIYLYLNAPRQLEFGSSSSKYIILVYHFSEVCLTCDSFFICTGGSLAYPLTPQLGGCPDTKKEAQADVPMEIETNTSQLGGGTGTNEATTSSDESMGKPLEALECEQCEEQKLVGASNTVSKTAAARIDGSCCEPSSSSFWGHHLLGRTVLACRGFGETAPWVIAKSESGRQLLVAMETVPDPTLHGMTLHAQRLCDVAAPGFFL